MNPTTLISEPSEFAQNFKQVAKFIQNRANTRLELQNKNSLSKINQKQTQTTEEKNSESQYNLQQLLIELAEQLNEGHTILTLDLTNADQYQLFEHLKNSEWVHLLSDTTVSIQKIDKPIIMQPPNVNNSTPQIDRVVVWLHRQWSAEHQLAEQLLAIAQRPIEPLNIQQPIAKASTQNATKTANERQQLAIYNASTHALSIITGGPGTGKTFTVAQLVMALQHAHNEKKKQDPHTPPLSIALTAPTGKAAQRMEESLAQSLPEGSELDKAKTLHRLLGIGSNGIPRYHHDNPLPDDLVIVDEASMLGLELASQLVDAIKPTGRLILLGDANQLAAVDAGAVLADLCSVEALQPYRTELTESRRFDATSAVGQLALTIKQPADTPAQKKQKISAVKKLLKQKNTAVSFYKLDTSDKTHPVNYPQIYQQLGEPFGDFFNTTKALLDKPLTLTTLEQEITEPGEGGALEQLFQTFDTYRILSAGHHGKLGDTAINQAISQFHKRKVLAIKPSDSLFYHGQPIMMLKNDYQLGVFNGDIGICLLVATHDDTSQTQKPPQLIACFPNKLIDISRLNGDSCTTAYALTIHKSQGSEFNHVAVCLDGMHARLLSQELIYTAVTRSKHRLDIYSNETVLNTAIVQKGNRQTGLSLQF